MTTNLDEFMAAYERALVREHAANPDAYSYPASGIPAVVAKMRKAFADGAAGGAWPCASKSRDYACKVVGIKPTWKALGEFLRAPARAHCLQLHIPGAGWSWISERGTTTLDPEQARDYGTREEAERHVRERDPKSSYAVRYVQRVIPVPAAAKAGGDS